MPTQGSPPSRKASAAKAGPVEVRSMSTPKPGWTIEAAVQLLADGYSPEQVERMTGFHARHVAAQAAALQKAQNPANPHGVVKPPEPVRSPESAQQASKASRAESKPEPFWPDVDD